MSITADMLHVAAMASWLGGLIMLAGAVLPRREPAELRAVLPTFSRVAFGSVVVLVTTGTYAAWRGIGSVHAIFATTYGLLVVTKVMLLLAVLVLGNLARRAIRRRYQPIPVAYAMADTALHDPPAHEEGQQRPAGEGLNESEIVRMRKTVRAEIALALGILLATAILVAEPRGKEALAADELHPSTATGQLGGGRSATVSVTPGRHGSIAADIALSPGPVPTKIVATATLPARQLGPIPLALVATGANSYAANSVDLPVAGDWVINLVVTTSQFTAVTTQVTVASVLIDPP